jgi:TonB family protein
MSKIITRSTVGILMALLFVQVVARGQTPAQTESQLLIQTVQNPRQLGPYFDLAKMYADQRRFDEAERILTRALAIIQQEKGVSVPTVSVPTAPTATSRMMISDSTAARAGDAPIRVGGDIKPPMKIKDVKPVYPADAMANNVQGVVIIEAIIDRDGNVSDTKVLRPVPMLEEAAVDAVRQWKFSQTLLNGVPVPVIMTVTVSFSLR